MPEGNGELSFTAFYDEFMPQVYRYVLYRVTDGPTAEDLTATIFEKAYRHWGRRRDPNSVAPWIFRIARNTVVSHFRWWRRRPQLSLDAAEGEPASEGRPELSFLQAERWQQLQSEVRKLSRREQDLVALKFGSGMSNRAIAPVLGLSESNVAVILHRAMRKLQTRLEAQETPCLPNQQEVSYG